MRFQCFNFVLACDVCCCVLKMFSFNRFQLDKASSLACCDDGHFVKHHHPDGIAVFHHFCKHL